MPGSLPAPLRQPASPTVAMARQSLPDLPLAFFTSLAVWAGFEAFSRADRRPNQWTARRWLILSAAACALATLTKGPVGVALPVLIVLPAVGLEYFLQSAERRRVAVNVRDLALALLVFLLIAVPWYATVTWVHGSEYLYRFFVAENLERFATARYNDPRPVWFYIPIVIGGLLPWSTFSLLWLRLPAGGFRQSMARSPELVRLALWAVIPLAVFSASVGKQPRYILPCLVPLAVLLGATISTRVRATSAGDRDFGLTLAGLVSGMILLAVGVLLYRVTPLVIATDGRRDRRLVGDRGCGCPLCAVCGGPPVRSVPSSHACGRRGSDAGRAAGGDHGVGRTPGGCQRCRDDFARAGARRRGVRVRGFSPESALLRPQPDDRGRHAGRSQRGPFRSNATDCGSRRAQAGRSRNRIESAVRPIVRDFLPEYCPAST